MISESALKKAFTDTENGFFNYVSSKVIELPEMAEAGSSCLVGIIYQKQLLIGHLGDSRAVMGIELAGQNKIVAQQMTKDHSVSSSDVREELKREHPHDHVIVCKRNGKWKIKGLTEVSRCIGDYYLKKPDFSHPFTSNHINTPVLRSDPDIDMNVIQPEVRFVIFASGGFWECVSNEEAVEMVNSSQKQGIAERLIQAALVEATRQGEPSQRDMIVCVLFFNHEMLNRSGEMNANHLHITNFRNGTTPKVIVPEDSNM